MTDVADFINEYRIFTVIEMYEYQLARKCIEIALDGGLKIIEISLLTPESFKLVEEFSKTEGTLTGLSQVTEIQDVKNAKEAGARFISTPLPKSDLIEEAHKQGLYVIGEALTPSEVVTAHKNNADMVGIFPIEPMGGSKYLKMLMHVYPHISFRARGGLNIYNFVDMLDVGARAVGVSSSLFDRKSLSRMDFEMLRKKVNLFLDRYRLWMTLHSRD